MERRGFLKLTGMLTVSGAAGTAALSRLSNPLVSGRTSPEPSQERGTTAPMSGGAPWIDIAEAGMYRISGQVRMEGPVLEISGITNAQQVSRSFTDGAPVAVVEFSSMEYFTRPGRMAEITVRGGQLKALSATPMNFG